MTQTHPSDNIEIIGKFFGDFQDVVAFPWVPQIFIPFGSGIPAQSSSVKMFFTLEF